MNTTTLPRLLRTLALASLTAAAALAALPARAQQALVDAEVVKVDKDQGKVRLKHGEIKSLGLPAFNSMAYRVKDAAVLDQLNPGDKLRFSAEKIDGQFTITVIQPVR